MIASGDDARGHVEETFASERRWEEVAGIDPPAVQVALAAGKPPEPLGAGGRRELKLDTGTRCMKAGDGLGQDELAPHRIGCNAEGASAPRAGGLELVQDAACGVGGGGPGRALPCGWPRSCDCAPLPARSGDALCGAERSGNTPLPTDILRLSPELWRIVSNLFDNAHDMWVEPNQKAGMGRLHQIHGFPMLAEASAGAVDHAMDAWLTRKPVEHLDRPLRYRECHGPLGDRIRSVALKQLAARSGASGGHRSAGTRVQDRGVDVLRRIACAGPSRTAAEGGIRRRATSRTFLEPSRGSC